MNASFFRLVNQIRGQQIRQELIKTPQKVISKFLSPATSTNPNAVISWKTHFKDYTRNSNLPYTRFNPETNGQISLNPRKTRYDPYRLKDNIYLPSDKGSEFCVIYRTNYNRLALEHLNDPSTYARVA